MTNILIEIANNKKIEVENDKKHYPQEKILDFIQTQKPPKNIIKKFQQSIVCGQIALIAEIKKASPSKGVIREDFNPVEIAKIYESSGAAAISVLTESKYFQGKLNYLNEVSKIVNIPVLRKDFIIDPYQIYQARACGADFILLIQDILSKSQMSEFIDISNSLGMESLVETHSEDDFDYHLSINTKIIGINNRNLKTFQTDINHTINLLKDKHTCKSFIVSESGINKFEDILKLSNVGVSAVLIGEHFMRQKDISVSIKKIFNPEPS